MKTLDFPIRVPSDVLEALGEFTGHAWSDSLALEPFICEAIRNYLRPAPAARTQASDSAVVNAGYQWKQLFLPEGTRLRASFGGHSYVAKVEGDVIKYGEQVVSPSQFANLQGSGNRNAWKAVWLSLPGSEEWLLADVLRSARKAAITRLTGDCTHAERPPLKQERRATERRTAKRAANGGPNCELRLLSPHRSGRWANDPPHSEPSTDGASATFAVIKHNGHQFKIKATRSGRPKRHAKHHLPGKR
jgi:hypothetical protein